MECRVHDLVRELAIEKAKEQNFIGTNIADPPPSSTSSSLFSSKSRRRSIYSDFERCASIEHLTPYLRSLLFFNLGKNCRASQLDFIAKCFKVLRNMRYLYMEGQEEDVPLQIHTLQNLQILSGITFNQWIKNDSSNLTCLEKLKLEGKCEVEGAVFSNSISKLPSLKSLYLKASDELSIPPLAINSCLHLSKLDIKGHMQKLLETVEFSPNLTQLTLEASRLGCDPMPVLEKQPKLLILRLRANAHLGMKMQVSANGFPQLKVLQLSELQGLTELNIGKGAMPWLKQLQIHKRVNILGFIGLLKLVELNIIGQPFPIMITIKWLPNSIAFEQTRTLILNIQWKVKTTQIISLQHCKDDFFFKFFYYDRRMKDMAEVYLNDIYSDIERYASIENLTPYLCSLLFFNLGKNCKASQLDFIAKCFKVA
ncbi:unnamed protein product, partial [Vitis vinifera]